MPLSKSAPVSTWIHDFVHSKNSKFEGKSRKERIRMALGAYYGKQNEERALDEARINKSYFSEAKHGPEKLNHDLRRHNSLMTNNPSEAEKHYDQMSREHGEEYAAHVRNAVIHKNKPNGWEHVAKASKILMPEEKVNEAKDGGSRKVPGTNRRVAVGGIEGTLARVNKPGHHLHGKTVKITRQRGPEHYEVYGPNKEGTKNTTHLFHYSELKNPNG